MLVQKSQINQQDQVLKPCIAELFVSIFHSFEAGVFFIRLELELPTQILQMNEKNIIYEKRTSPKLNYLIN